MASSTYSIVTIVSSVIITIMTIIITIIIVVITIIIVIIIIINIIVIIKKHNGESHGVASLKELRGRSSSVDL